MHDVDVPTIRKFFDEHIYVNGFCAEVRCPRSRIDYRSKTVVPAEKGANPTIVGWFTRSDELACELRRLRGVSALITFNPVKIDGRPAGARNRLVPGRKGMFAVADDVAMLRYCMVDIDPAKTTPPRRQPSTDAERDACRDMAAEITAKFGLGGRCLSGRGNGAFLLVRLPDWPNTEEHRARMCRLVRSIASEYSTVRCHVDPNTYQPHQGVGIPGTYRIKGEETPDRPYRLVTLEETSDADTADRLGRPVLATA